jgi:hypothetical protein
MLGLFKIFTLDIFNSEVFRIFVKHKVLVQIKSLPTSQKSFPWFSLIPESRSNLYWRVCFLLCLLELSFSTKLIRLKLPPIYAISYSILWVLFKLKFCFIYEQFFIQRFALFSIDFFLGRRYFFFKKPSGVLLNSKFWFV